MENETQTAETQPEIQQAKKVGRFAIVPKASIDPMTEFREAAAAMEFGEVVDGLDKTDAARLAKAINERLERSASVEANKDGTYRVARVPQRALRGPKVKPATEGSTEKKATTKKGGK